jgi:hypothetical protein
LAVAAGFLVVVALVVVAVVVAIVVVAIALGVGLTVLSYRRGRWGVPGMALCRPSTLICQTEKLGNLLDVVRGDLLQHLLIPHTLAECNHNRSIGDMRDGVVNLRESLGEGAQWFPQALLHGMEVGLIAWVRVGTLKVDCELMA